MNHKYMKGIINYNDKNLYTTYYFMKSWYNPYNISATWKVTPKLYDKLIYIFLFLSHVIDKAIPLQSLN